MGGVLYCSVNSKRKAISRDSLERMSRTRTSVSLVDMRMPKLNARDIDKQLGKSETRRLSAYSTKRRDSEVAREIRINRDIDAAVKVKKNEIRTSLSSSQRQSCGSVEMQDIEADIGVSLC